MNIIVLFKNVFIFPHSTRCFPLKYVTNKEENISIFASFIFFFKTNIILKFQVDHMAWKDFCGAWQPLRTVCMKRWFKTFYFCEKKSRRNLEQRENNNIFLKVNHAFESFRSWIRLHVVWLFNLIVFFSFKYHILCASSTLCLKQ